MNKYQEYLLSHIKDNGKGTFLFSDCAPVGKSCKDDTYGCYDKKTNFFTIKQDQDITKTIYELAISKSKCPFIDSVQVKTNNTYIDIPISKDTTTTQTNMSRAGMLRAKGSGEDQFVIAVDFNDRIDAIRLKFIKNIADDLEIKIAYQEADKQAYAERQEVLRKENTLKRAAINHSVGESLVNIYFQPCADNYDHSEISLFIPEKTEIIKVGGRYGLVNRENVLSWAVIMKATVENGIFFKSITGLAYGRYAYVVKQFDKENNLLIETDHIEFYIRPKQQPIVEQGNIVVI